MKNYVYIVFHYGISLVKIGRSTNPKSRLKSLETSNMHLNGMYAVEAHPWVEGILHELFIGDKYKNEWFSFNRLLKEESVEPFFFIAEIEDYEEYKKEVVKMFSWASKHCIEYLDSIGVKNTTKIKVNYHRALNKRKTVFHNAIEYIISKLKEEVGDE
jgi:hypothetical protein